MEFTCSGCGDFINWHLNGSYITDNFPGIDVLPTESQGTFRSSVLRVNASFEKDYSVIKCLIFLVLSNSSKESDPVVLRIQGT